MSSGTTNSLLPKSGFVYIWYDSFRKMYYIGKHWGYEYDSYICSSDRMRKAYRRRPQDFKRRILVRNIPTDEETLKEEHRWLSMIKDEELGKRYYNLSNKQFNHWSSAPYSLLTTSQKLSLALKGRKQNLTPEQSEARSKAISEGRQKSKEKRLKQGLPIRNPEKNPRPPKGPQSPESNAKRSEAMKKAWKEGRNKGTTGRTYEWSEERRQNHKQGVQGCHENRNPEAYSTSGKKAWAEGKYANRKSNNMRDFIWVTFKENGTRTRIRNDRFDPTIHIKGRKPIEPKYL